MPTQGTYVVELDESTLPEGIKLADGQENPREVTFSQTSNLSVIFAFGEGIVVQEQDFGQNLINRLVAGLSFGLLLALASVGLSLIFGTTGLTNFAHGEMVTLGAVLVFAFNAMNLPFWLAILLALLGGGFVRLRPGCRPLEAAPAARHRPGADDDRQHRPRPGRPLRHPVLLRRAIQQLPYARARRSRSGRSPSRRDNLWSLVISACGHRHPRNRSCSRPGSQSHPRGLRTTRRWQRPRGIDVDSVIRLSGSPDGMLAALGGVLFGLYQRMNTCSAQILLLIFAGVALGGLGTVCGAMIGRILVGLLIELTTLFGLAAASRTSAPSFVLIIILLSDPRVCLGRRERVG